jgi:hypothetical protein
VSSAQLRLAVVAAALVYVNDALAQVAEARRGAAETAGAQLRTECAADPEVRMDPVRISQLVAGVLAPGRRFLAADLVRR